MELIDAIRSRRSIRSFKSTPVPREALEALVETCRWSPSSSNTQPWELAILGGALAEEVKERFLQKTKEGWDKSTFTMKNANPDIPQPSLAGPFLRRAFDIRERLDRHQFPPGTKDLDAKRNEYLLNGARFYGAPNAVILLTERSVFPKALFDAGLIAQTLCLAALGYGLGTCLMTMLVMWPDVLREVLRIPETKMFVLGIAIGYPDLEAPINRFDRAREPAGAFTHWYGL